MLERCDFFCLEIQDFCDILLSQNVIGTPGDDNQLGSAYIFTRSGMVWSEQQKLMPDKGPNGQFGDSVSINGDTVAIGTTFDLGNGTSSGAAYIFTQSGMVWTQQQKLTPNDGEAVDLFGDSVSINGDTVVVGSSADDDNGSNSGSAYVFTRSGVTWSLQQKLIASDGTGSDMFGTSVAIEEDTIVIGANFGDGNGTESGLAYSFKRNGTNWAEQRRLRVSNGADNDDFGISVAISGTKVIGGANLRDIAPSAFSDDKKNGNFAGENQGAAYFFGLPASISGRVLTQNGSGVPGAFVQMTDEADNIRTARTNQFGYYRFEEIDVGQILVFNVFSKLYQFEMQTVDFEDALTGFDFIAQ